MAVDCCVIFLCYCSSFSMHSASTFSAAMRSSSALSAATRSSSLSLLKCALTLLSLMQCGPLPLSHLLFVLLSILLQPGPHYFPAHCPSQSSFSWHYPCIAAYALLEMPTPLGGWLLCDVSVCYFLILYPTRAYDCLGGGVVWRFERSGDG